MSQRQSQMSDFQIVLFLLAIVTGTHGISEILLETVLRRNSDTLASVRDLHTILDLMEQSLQESSSEDWKRLVSWLAPSGLKNPLRIEVDLQRLAEWAPRVARYGFRIERHS